MSLFECSICDWVLDAVECEMHNDKHFCPVCGVQMSLKTEFSSVPAFALKPEFGEKRSRVLNFLRENSGKWITSRVIAEKCGFPVEGTCVSLRYAITQLQFEFFMPIVSGNNGFKFARSRSEVMAFVRRLEQKKQSLSAKQAALCEAANRMEVQKFDFV